MSESKSIVSQFVLIGLLNLLVSFSGLVLLPVLTKNLSSADYGVWAQVNSTISLFPAVVMLGLPYAMVRFLAAEKSREAISDSFYSVLAVTLAASGLVAAVLFLFSRELAGLLFAGDAAIVGLVAAIVVLECVNLHFVSYFRMLQQVLKYTLFMIFKTVLNLAAVVLLVLAGRGLTGAVAGFLISDLVTGLVMLAFIVPEIGIRLPRFRQLREYLRFGLPTVPSNLSSWVANASDRYVIGGFLGASSVAYYSTGYWLGATITMFVTPLSFLLPSILSRYYDENDQATVKIVLDRSLKYFLLIAIPSVFGLTLLSRPVLELFSTPEIASQGYLITPLIALSTTMLGVYAIVSQILVLEKNTKVLGQLWIVIALVYFGLNLLTVPVVGILGAALASVAVYSLTLAGTLFYAGKYTKIHFDLGFIAKCILSSLVMSVPLALIHPADIAGIAGTILLCVSVYLLVLSLLKGIQREELGLLRQFIKV